MHLNVGASRVVAKCLAPISKLWESGIHRDQHANFQSENLSRALLTVAQIMGSKKTDLGLDGGKATAALSGIQI